MADVPGWACFDGVVIGNRHQTLSYVRQLLAGVDGLPYQVDTDCLCGVLGEESPDGLGNWADPVTDQAPWYTAGIPDSADFMGLYIIGNTIQDGISGLDTVPFTRTQRPGPIVGSFLGKPELGGRVVTFTGYMMGRTPEGLEYGKRWLSDVLQGCNDGDCGLSELCVFPVCPSVSGVAADAYKRTLYRTGLVFGPTYDDQDCFGPNSERVTFQIAAEVPWLFLDPVTVLDEATFTFPPGTTVCTDTCVDTPVLPPILLVGQSVEDAETPGGLPPGADVDTWHYIVKNPNPFDLDVTIQVNDGNMDQADVGLPPGTWQNTQVVSINVPANGQTTYDASSRVEVPPAVVPITNGDFYAFRAVWDAYPLNPSNETSIRWPQKISGGVPASTDVGNPFLNPGVPFMKPAPPGFNIEGYATNRGPNFLAGFAVRFDANGNPTTNYDYHWFVENSAFTGNSEIIEVDLSSQTEVPIFTPLPRQLLNWAQTRFGIPFISGGVVATNTWLRPRGWFRPNISGPGTESGTAADNTWPWDGSIPPNTVWNAGGTTSDKHTRPQMRVQDGLTEYASLEQVTDCTTECVDMGTDECEECCSETCCDNLGDCGQRESVCAVFETADFARESTVRIIIEAGHMDVTNMHVTVSPNPPNIDACPGCTQCSEDWLVNVVIPFLPAGTRLVFDGPTRDVFVADNNNCKIRDGWEYIDPRAPFDTIADIGPCARVCVCVSAHSGCIDKDSAKVTIERVDRET